jgi:hypothetical protein
MKYFATPSTDLLKQLRLDDGLKAAIASLQVAITKASQGLMHNGAVVSLAMKHADKDSTPIEAVERLANLIETLAAEMAQCAAAWDSMADETNEAVKPLIALALDLDAILIKRIVMCDGAVTASEKARQSKIDALVDAGVEMVQAESIAGEATTNALALAVAESKQARNDRAAIARFIFTGDANDAPQIVKDHTVMQPPGPTSYAVAFGVAK